MQLKYNTYSAAKKPIRCSEKQKLQETIPVFTIIKGAQVPIKPAGPKKNDICDCCIHHYEHDISTYIT